MSTISSKVYSPYNDPFRYYDWDPFRDFDQYERSALNHHHHTVAGHPTTPGAFVSPQIEWKETPGAHVVKAQVPGLRREEVKVELEEGGNVLCITGEKNVEKEEKGDNWYHVVHSSGKSVQRFRLPEKVKADKMKAHMENGVITITIAKREIHMPSKTTIRIF